MSARDRQATAVSPVAGRPVAGEPRPTGTRVPTFPDGGAAGGELEAALLLTALIRHIDQLRKAAMRPVLAPHRVNETQWRILSLLEQAEVNTAADIARRLEHDAGSLTRALDALEERRLVSRRRSPKDRRAVHLEVTPEGDRIAERCTGGVTALWDGLLRDWSENDVATLSASLDRLGASVRSAQARTATSRSASAGRKTVWTPHRISSR